MSWDVLPWLVGSKGWGRRMIREEGLCYVKVTYGECYTANHGKPFVGGCEMHWGGR